MSSVAVIGAGIGGLSTAIRTAAEGRSVTLFEAAPEIGGKLRQLHLGDYRLDSVPAFTWPDLLLRPSRSRETCCPSTTFTPTGPATIGRRNPPHRVDQR